MTDKSLPRQGKPTAAVIAPILHDTYGKGTMVNALAAHLGEQLDKWPEVGRRDPAETREDFIRQVCWTWFSGGSTAESVARKIEEAIPLAR